MPFPAKMTLHAIAKHLYHAMAHSAPLNSVKSMNCQHWAVYLS